MKFKDFLNEAKMPDDVKALKAINKFIVTLDNPTIYPEDKFYDYGSGKIIITNKFTGNINFFGSVVKKNPEISMLPVTISERYVKTIKTNEISDVTISIRIQLGDNPGSINFSTETEDFTISGIKKAFKESLNKAKKSSFGKVKVLSKILRYKQPLSSNEVSNTTHIGIGSASSVNINRSYEKIVDIKDLTKIFSEKEFKEAVRTDYSLRKHKISFNFKKGLMDKSGTWTETWD